MWSSLGGPVIPAAPAAPPQQPDPRPCPPQAASSLSLNPGRKSGPFRPLQACHRLACGAIADAWTRFACRAAQGLCGAFKNCITGQVSGFGSLEGQKTSRRRTKRGGMLNVGRVMQDTGARGLFFKCRANSSWKHLLHAAPHSQHNNQAERSGRVWQELLLTSSNKTSCYPTPQDYLNISQGQLLQST